MSFINPILFDFSKVPDQKMQYLENRLIGNPKPFEFTNTPFKFDTTNLFDNHTIIKDFPILYTGYEQRFKRADKVIVDSEGDVIMRDVSPPPNAPPKQAN
jgi:hypothetical protein